MTDNRKIQEFYFKVKGSKRNDEVKFNHQVNLVIDRLRKTYQLINHEVTSNTGMIDDDFIYNRFRVRIRFTEKVDKRKNNGGARSNAGRKGLKHLYGEEVVKKELRIPISAMENIDLVLLCYEIKAQVTGVIRSGIEASMAKKDFASIIQFMQESTPPELRESTVKKLRNIVL